MIFVLTKLFPWLGEDIMIILVIIISSPCWGVFGETRIDMIPKFCLLIGKYNIPL